MDNSNNTFDFLREFAKEMDANNDIEKAKRVVSSILAAIREFQSAEQANEFYDLLPDYLNQFTDREWRIKKRNIEDITADEFAHEIFFADGKAAENDFNTPAKALNYTGDCFCLLAKELPGEHKRRIYQLLPGEVADIWMEAVLSELSDSGRAVK